MLCPNYPPLRLRWLLPREPWLAPKRLMKQRPEFSSGQILGHWQGAYGVEATATLRELMGKITLFHRARELSTEDREHPFDPSQEFAAALHHLKKRVQQQNFDAIVQRLNQKPLGEWSNADKLLYRKATNPLNH